MALPPLIPVEDFFRPPTRAAATLSPDGTKLAFLAPWQHRLNVWIEDLHTSDVPAEPRCVTADANRSIFHYEWTDDPRWMIYLQDTNGDENWHVVRVDLDDAEAAAVDLTPFPGVMALPVREVKDGKTAVMVNNREPTLLDLHELDIVTGELTLIAENPGHVNNWLNNDKGDVLATSLTPEGHLELSRWNGESLLRIATFDGTDYPVGIDPMVITPDGTGVWMGSNRGTDRTRLVHVDLSTGDETEVDSHPQFDLDPRSTVSPLMPAPLIRHRRTGALLAVRYLGERQVIRPLDAQFADVLASLETLSAGDITRLSSDEAGQRWVVGFNDDRDPGATYLYDHSTGQSRLLYRPLPHLEPASLAPMRPVTIPSRDGLALHSYLTLPIGVEPDKLPLVLVVHGGPWYRDSWGFDAGVQMLANRGYAVLQVNFRGSTGYGKAFLKAAVGEFAGKMHDDLIDGVNWAVDQGYADPDRVAIFGGSYGGYATLVGVTFTPEVFAAAIDYVGISDLANFMRTLPAIARPHLANNWHAYVGDPDDPAQLADMQERSPITRVDQIRTPLLVIQGANDVRVVQAESDNLVDALRERGVEVDYLVQTTEGHGAVNPEAVIEMYQKISEFLARHLGGRA